MIRRWWLGPLVIGLLASGLPARQGSVTTHDGRTLIGDIQTSPDGKSVIISLHGATFTVPKDNIASINYPAEARDDFNKRLGSLDPDDIKGRIDLSRFELDAGQYDLAAEAAKDAERLDAHNPDAVMLLDTIQSQHNLDAKLATAASSPPSAAESAPANPATGYLSLDDVYEIRRDELRPDDNVHLQFFNDVRKRYLGQQGNARAFYAESDIQQAIDILQTADPHLAKDVHPVTDPATLMEFRRQIQPRILAGCAAAGCHGSEGSGGVFLYFDAKEVLPAYTNFYILQKIGRTIEGGNTFGAGPVYRPMIDRVHPQASLLLQFGLPRSVAATPHPDVPGFTPIFRGLTDPIYLEVYHWIGSLAPFTPDYGIKFDLPTGKAPTTQGPTTQGP
jgi:hypothetical protein